MHMVVLVAEATVPFFFFFFFFLTFFHPLFQCFSSSVSGLLQLRSSLASVLQGMHMSALLGLLCPGIVHFFLNLISPFLYPIVNLLSILFVNLFSAFPVGKMTWKKHYWTFLHPFYLHFTILHVWIWVCFLYKYTHRFQYTQWVSICSSQLHHCR